MNISKCLNTAAMRMVAFILVCLSVFGLSGCGGGSGGSAPGVTGKSIATGVFLDSKVEGITYVSGSVSGVTDANGTFHYEKGSTVRFMIGGLVIGIAQGKKVITPVDFVSGGDTSNPTVLNIVRFLVTIDSDGNPDNGIQITKTMRNQTSGDSIKFTQSATNFAANGNVQIIVSEITAVTTAGARTLVADNVAKKHLSGTLLNYYAGSYSGTFSGNDSGSFNVRIVGNGLITGTGSSNSAGTFSVSGQLSADGNLTFATGGTSTSATFTGKIGTSGALSGTWKNASETGKFSGQRSASKTGSNNTSTGNTGGSNTGSGNTVGNTNAYGSFTLSGAGLTGTYIPKNGPLLALNPSLLLQELWQGDTGNYGVWSISTSIFNSSGTISSVITFSNGINTTSYSCKTGIFGLYGDCSGVLNDVSTRTVTFSNVKLRGPGFGAVIQLNGALKY